MGKLTYFEKKLEKAVVQLMNASSPSPVKDLPAPAVTIKTQKITQGGYEGKVQQGKKLVTTMFVKLAKGERKGTQDDIVGLDQVL